MHYTLRSMQKMKLLIYFKLFKRLTQKIPKVNLDYY